jgi:hypothetical protein
MPHILVRRRVCERLVAFSIFIEQQYVAGDRFCVANRGGEGTVHCVNPVSALRQLAACRTPAASRVVECWDDEKRWATYEELSGL